jgi:cyanoexosortase A
MDWLTRLQEPKYWLLGVAAAIIALHLTLVGRVDDSELFASSLLFWVAAGSLVWDRRHTLVLESGIFCTILGILLLALVLARSLTPANATSLLRILPFVSVLGLCLLASGIRRVGEYWKELFMFGLFALYPLLALALQMIDLPSLTAQTGHMLLWYTGFEVKRQGLFLFLPTGRVEVYGACSGLHSVLQMLNISVLFLLMFPLRSHLQKVFCIVVAVILGFVVNALRVALMAILVAFSNKQAFEYWHGGDGSLVFSMISVLLFGCFCWFVFLRNPQKPADTGAQTNG